MTRVSVDDVGAPTREGGDFPSRGVGSAGYLGRRGVGALDAGAVRRAVADQVSDEGADCHVGESLPEDFDEDVAKNGVNDESPGEEEELHHGHRGCQFGLGMAFFEAVKPRS